MGFDVSQLPPPPDLRHWSFLESFAAETDDLRRAREASAEIGVGVVSPAAGAALRFLARTLDAKHVVEIGTGVGSALLWVLQGMAADGQVTTLDSDGEHHRLAKELVKEAPGRVRFITGRAAEVVPRLADHSYDLVLLSMDSADLNPMLDQAVRLLRLGGVIALLDAFGGGKVGDPAQRDPSSVARRLVLHRFASDPRLTPALLPVGTGLLVATVDSFDLPSH